MPRPAGDRLSQPTERVSKPRGIKLDIIAVVVAVLTALFTLAQAVLQLPEVQKEVPLPWAARGTIHTPTDSTPPLERRRVDISGTVKHLPKSYSLVLVVFATDDTVYYPLEPFRPEKGSDSWSRKQVIFGEKGPLEKPDEFIITLYSASPDATRITNRLLKGSANGGAKNLPTVGLEVLDETVVKRVK
jgi:hypothetical protein